MRLQLDSLGKIKSYVHAGQAAILAFAMVLTIAIFTRDGKSDGRVGWYFGLCWLTIPILIYLVMVPMWSRAQKFANVYAFAVLDGVSIVLWLSAWASMASYVASGKGKGADNKKSGCDNFKYGSPGRCKLSTGVTILGVMLDLAFLVTAYMSFRALMTYKRTGMMPINPVKQNDFSIQTQDAFSSNIRHDEFEDDQATDARQGGYAYQQPHVEDEEYAPMYQNDHDDIGHIHPAQPVSPLNPSGLGISNYDTSYGGAHGQHSPVVSPEEDPRAQYSKYETQSYSR